MPPEIVLFVFRRRGTRTISVRRTCLDAGNLVGSLLGLPRRRKTKRRGIICVLPYKQATPAGFAVEATNSQPRHGGALREVGTDKAFMPLQRSIPKSWSTINPLSPVALRAGL